MTTVELPNGVESAYTYDDADRLTGIDHVLGLDTLAFVDYTLDAVGNRTQRVDGQGTHTYTYDDVYRLVEVTYPGPSTTAYAYDAFGNRTSMTVGANTTTYAYDDADRLTSVDPPADPPVAYTWDDNGNLTDRDSDAFEWDFEDRLVEATVDSVTTTFAYRGDGLRDSRTVGMTTTTFTWDIAGGLPVVLDDGTARYVYGPSGLIAQKTATDDFYYLADGLGSTMAIADDAGDVVRDYTYDVYGQVTGGSGSTPNEFDFAGQQSDDSTGLQYLRARYYDPATGVFISRDPLAAGPGWLGNPHGYVDGNPTNLVDPLGLWGCGWLNDICGGIGSIVGGIGGASDWVKGQLVAGAQKAGGITKSTLKWVKSVGWNAARAHANRFLTAWALGLAKSLGGSCQTRSDGIIGCFGVKKLLDRLGATAVTIGNVILTDEYSWSDLGSDLIAHEVRHADQWALAGLSTIGVSPLVGQGGMLATYGAAQAVFKACGNPFEIAAGLEAGGYSC